MGFILSVFGFDTQALKAELAQHSLE